MMPGYKSKILMRYRCVKCEGPICRTYRKHLLTGEIIIRNECMTCCNEIRSVVLKKYRLEKPVEFNNTCR